MASQFQQVIYEGYLGSDPDMKYTPSGSPVANFRLGSTRTYKNKSEELVKETTWLKVACWGSLAEKVVAKYCKKGSHVLVIGTLRPGPNGNPSVFTLSNGESAASYEVIATSVRLLDKKDSTGESEEESHSDSSDIPF